MTGGQQNIHKYIWLAIVCIVPILIFMALSHRYDNREALDYSPEKIANGTSLVFEQDWMNTTLLDQSGQLTLIIDLKQSPKYPSVLVYTLNRQGEKERLLGQLLGKGRYEFQLGTATEGIVFYDALKEIQIEELKFSWD